MRRTCFIVFLVILAGFSSAKKKRRSRHHVIRAEHRDAGRLFFFANNVFVGQLRQSTNPLKDKAKGLQSGFRNWLKINL